jgi:hypothetical protein
MHLKKEITYQIIPDQKKKTKFSYVTKLVALVYAITRSLDLMPLDYFCRCVNYMVYWQISQTELL